MPLITTSSDATSVTTGTTRTASIASDASDASNASDKDARAFERDEAIQIIIAGLQSGAIILPFTKAFDTSLANKFFNQKQNSVNSQWTVEFVRGAEGRAIAATFADIARRDALYLLTFFHTLVVGLSEEEAQRIVDIATRR